MEEKKRKEKKENQEMEKSRENKFANKSRNRVWSLENCALIPQTPMFKGEK